MNCIFKEVGQGDSIIIKWKGIKKLNLGIIDCNSTSSIPTITELSLIPNLKNIEFIILSHPHFDHYSGMRKLLLYLRDNEIYVERFLHTSSVIPEYLGAACENEIEAKELGSLFKLVDQLYTSNFIKAVGIIDNTTNTFEMNSILKFRILSPSYAENREFNKQVKLNKQTDPNLLSTIIEIEDGENYCLLTSDAIAKSFKRLNKEGYVDKMKSKFLNFGQIPHHGAKSNYHDSFWRNLNRKPDVKAVFSVGSNSYGHPSNDVVNFLSKSSYQCEFTNEIQNSPFSTLDLISEKVSISSKDLKYLLF